MTAPRLSPFFKLVAIDQIGSTNEEAKRLASDGAPAGTLVWAREQLAGRGRRGRSWASPPGNLYLSLLLRPACPPAQACQLNFVTTVALASAVAMLLPAGATVTLKWPNDVLVGDAKISGILLEAGAAGDRSVDWLVIGVGVNLVSHPSDTAYAATDLLSEGAVAPGPEEALSVFSEQFEAWHAVWLKEGFSPIRSRWIALARGLGEAIEVRLEQETLRGRFSDLDETGALMLYMSDGTRRQITTGDLFFPRL